MNPFTLLDPVVLALHHLVVALADALPGTHGGTGLAVATALVTVAVRAAMLPFAVRALRGERARAAIAPRLAELRRRYRKDPQRLLAETGRVQREAGVSTLSGMLPLLAQLPVLASVYRLFTVPVLAGQPNLVLTTHLFGAPLAAHWPEVLTAGGLLGPGALALLVGLAALSLLATLTSRDVARRGAEALAAAGDEAPALAAVQRVLRLLPYGTVALAIVSPVAVGLYLLVSTTWTVAERRILPRVVPA